MSQIEVENKENQNSTTPWTREFQEEKRMEYCTEAKDEKVYKETIESVTFKRAGSEGLESKLNGIKDVRILMQSVWRNLKGQGRAGR